MCWGRDFLHLMEWGSPAEARASEHKERDVRVSGVECTGTSPPPGDRGRASAVWEKTGAGSTGCDGV